MEGIRLELLKRIYDTAMESNDLLPFIPLDDYEESKLDYQYLNQKGYIYVNDTQRPLYSARLTAKGIDLIETGKTV